MKNIALIKSLVVLFILSSLAGSVAQPLPHSSVARAASPNLNLVTGLFNTISALNKRNRVYGEARATSQEINAYYDAQIETAERLRQEAVSRAASGEASAASVRSYIRVTAALEAERQAAIYLIEAEKNDARRKFNQNLANEIKRVLLASPGGRNLLADIKETISRTRQAAAAVQAAANAGQPTQILVNALNDDLANIQPVRDLAQDLGSKIGNKIDRALGGAISRIEHALTDVSGEMGEAINQLDQLEADINQAQTQTGYPASLLGENLPGDLIPLSQGEAGQEAAAAAFAIAAENAGTLGPGETRATMIDKIRNALQDATLTELMSSLLGVEAGQIYCTVTSRADFEAASSALGVPPQEAQNPAEARYLVCYDVQTHEPRIARLLESKTAVETEDAGDVFAEDVPDLAACVVPVDSYSWGYENIKRNDCTDPARCTGCGGTFVFQNDSDQEIEFYHYYYNDFHTPIYDDWIKYSSILKPGERFEEDVSIDNRWKQGLTYKSNVVKILVIWRSPECIDFPATQREIYAAPIDPLPCE